MGSVSNASARLLAADGLTRIRFVPTGGFTGTVSNGITFRAWDQTTGTNGGLGNATVNGGSAGLTAAEEIYLTD